MILKELLNKYNIKIKLNKGVLEIPLEVSLDNFKDYKTKTNGVIVFNGEEIINEEDNIIREISLTINPNDADETVIIESSIEDNFKQHTVWNDNGGLTRLG